MGRNRFQIQWIKLILCWHWGNGLVIFNGLNFNDWFEHMYFQLGIKNLDLAIVTDKPGDVTEASSEEDWSVHEA